MRFHWNTDVREMGTQAIVRGAQRLMRPRIVAHAEIAQEEVEIAGPRDAGWAELWSEEGDVRIGRGHLVLWTDPSVVHAAVADADVHVDAAQPVGWSAGNLRAELRTFTPDTDMPGAGIACLVIPEGDQERHPVQLVDVIENDEGGKATLEIDWPDGELPASLTELGGH